MITLASTSSHQASELEYVLGSGAVYRDNFLRGFSLGIFELPLAGFLCLAFGKMEEKAGTL